MRAGDLAGLDQLNRRVDGMRGAQRAGDAGVDQRNGAALEDIGELEPLVRESCAAGAIAPAPASSMSASMVAKSKYVTRSSPCPPLSRGRL